MNDIELLDLLDTYYIAQRTVVTYMLCAMESFEEEEMVWMWEALFDWCEAKDRRDELFFKFKNDYARAVMLKDGYEI